MDRVYRDARLRLKWMFFPGFDLYTEDVTAFFRGSLSKVV